MDREQTRHPTRGQSVCPFLEALAQEVNETIDLATLYGTRDATASLLRVS
jgi:hypothetical protein